MSAWLLQTKIAAETIPQRESGGNCRNPKRDELPRRRAFSQQIDRIARGRKRLTADVRSINDQAKACEELQQKCVAAKPSPREQKWNKGEQAAEEWTTPGYDCGVWVL